MKVVRTFERGINRTTLLFYNKTTLTHPKGSGHIYDVENYSNSRLCWGSSEGRIAYVLGLGWAHYRDGKTNN